MAEQVRLGGEWLRAPLNHTAVIFVHGILSSTQGAWTHANGAFWPDMLATDNELENLGVAVFGYRADWRSRTYSISDAADSLREFANEANLWALQPVIFVCHSMGGIVVRRLLIANQRELIDRNSRIGLFFIASPSLGSRDANKVLRLTRKLGNIQAQALRLAEDNTWLNDLDKDFMKLKESARLTMSGKELIEDEPVPIKKLFGLWTQVVPTFSAARYFSDSLKIAGTDHNSIGKPASRRSEQYKALKRFIQSAASLAPPYLPNLEEYESSRAVTALSEIRQRLTASGITEFEVLNAIQEALLETRSYLARRATGEPRDGKSEDLLSQVWAGAARAIGPYDSKLAELCWVKGHGWADESVWRDPRFKDLPIAVNDMLESLLAATRRASKSAHRTAQRSAHFAEGTLHLDTVTWRTVVLLPPFSQSPQVTLSRRDSQPGEAPRLESVTPDTFAVSIQSSPQAGEWNWRARGEPIDSDVTSIVEGDVSLTIGTTTVLLPPFSDPPVISLVRPDGRARYEPKLEGITEDKFAVLASRSDDQGLWKWRARGELLKRTI